MSTPISPLRRFGWLLRRELWEHRIGLVWAPLVAGGASLLLSAIALVAGVHALQQELPQRGIRHNDELIQINGLDLSTLASQLEPSQIQQLTGALNVSLLISSSWPLMVMAFVAFFYAAGALYDDRRDRSILFWKSLPVSDLSTVLSKAVTAVVVAPVIAVLASVLTLLGFTALLCIAVAWLGGNPMELVLGPASVAGVAGTLLGAVPVYALWALPTVGWLLLCSAALPRVPFLLALLVPLLAGALLSATGLAGVVGLDNTTLWGQGILRLLTGTLPGVHLAWQFDTGHDASVAAWPLAPSPLPAYEALDLATLWIGAIVGAALVGLAVLVRRRSDDT